MDSQDPEVLGGAATYYQGTNLTDPHVVAKQSGDTDNASGLDFPLARSGVVVNIPHMPTGSKKSVSNFVINEGDNNAFTMQSGV